jgi:1-acylglycerone phosphate reductase
MWRRKWVLIFIAGYTMPLLDASLEETRKLFELNVFSVLAVTQAFAPSLITAKGKIINIGSIVGKMAQAYTGICLRILPLGLF